MDKQVGVSLGSVVPTVGQRITQSAARNCEDYPQYPKHLQEIERVRWSGNLPILSQHDAIWQTVEAVLNHARDYELLHQSDQSDQASSKPPKLDRIDRSFALLVNRAKIRNATFRISEFGAVDHITDFQGSPSRLPSLLHLLLRAAKQCPRDSPPLQPRVPLKPRHQTLHPIPPRRARGERHGVALMEENRRGLYETKAKGLIRM